MLLGSLSPSHLGARSSNTHTCLLHTPRLLEQALRHLASSSHHLPMQSQTPASTSTECDWHIQVLLTSTMLLSPSPFVHQFHARYTWSADSVQIIVGESCTSVWCSMHSRSLSHYSLRLWTPRWCALLTALHHMDNNLAHPHNVSVT